MLTVIVSSRILCGPRTIRAHGSAPCISARRPPAAAPTSRSSKAGAKAPWCASRGKATLGRLDELQRSGQLERLLRSGARFADKAILVEAVASGDVTASAARRIGPALVFERLWEETGCRAVVEKLAGARNHGFPLERAIFLSVLHRLFSGGSDRAADRWREDYRIEGADRLELHHLYRAMAWLKRGVGQQPTGRRHALRAALPEGRPGGGPVRAAARFVQRARSGVHGHDEPLFRRRGRQSLKNLRLGGAASPRTTGPIATRSFWLCCARRPDPPPASRCAPPPCRPPCVKSPTPEPPLPPRMQRHGAFPAPIRAGNQ